MFVPSYHWPCSVLSKHWRRSTTPCFLTDSFRMYSAFTPPPSSPPQLLTPAFSPPYSLTDSFRMYSAFTPPSSPP